MVNLAWCSVRRPSLFLLLMVLVVLRDSPRIFASMPMMVSALVTKQWLSLCTGAEFIIPYTYKVSKTWTISEIKEHL